MKEKIRAWDKFSKQMFYYNDIWCGISREEREHFSSGDKISMHFTGQTDKNGKEIYEGDIVVHCKRDFLDSGTCGQTSFLLAGIVEYDEKWASFVIKTPKHNDHISLYCQTEWPDEYRPFDYNEVLGNIYEDPKMVKELKQLGAVRFLWKKKEDEK